MTVLSNVAIRARIESGDLMIEPLYENAVQPASVDVHLGGTVLKRRVYSVVDPERDHSGDYSTEPRDPAIGGWVLRPGDIYLATIAEWLSIPADLVAFIHGCSTEARLGIVPHQQAGLLDCGYEGRPTLELSVSYPTLLRPGVRIGQVVFHRVDPPADPVYAGRYQSDTAPQPARAVRP